MQWLWRKIKSFFGISSPSKLFRDSIGANLALGLGLGFEDEMNKVADQMQAAVPTTLDAGGISLNGVSGTATVTSGPLVSVQQLIVRSEDDIRAIYQQLKDHGSSAGTAVPLMPFADLTRLMGFEDVYAFEKRYAET